ncbi:MAG: hypothetical protein UY35_C0009G0024 [Candidatus Saccharibacteria bacterium GW2011_GWC2_48_9]|nr:MAG: hypothetical protein UY35_C0009G0024 [Candidatus Saccharibacteria bacterium GW2011_GWC2_48_9]
MKYFISTLLLGFSLLVASLAVGVIAPTTATAADSTTEACQKLGSSSAFCASKKDSVSGTNGFAKIVTNILLFLVGTAAVIMIILGGIKYTTSNGDPSQIKSAKDTILYSVVGLIVAIMAWGIVTFVIDQAAPDTSSTSGSGNTNNNSGQQPAQGN